MRKKDQLPKKICLNCNKEFFWRKKWKKNWDFVKYCSKKCSRNYCKIKHNNLKFNEIIV
jgi:hypothetical protein